MPTFTTKALWGARCRRSARRVLTGETSSRGHACSVRTLVRKHQPRRGSATATTSRLVSTDRSIPHSELMRSLARRIVDGRVLHLIKMWLECAVEDTDDKGRKTRTTEAKDSGRGIPQGSPISPLLANLYMRRFVLGLAGVNYFFLRIASPVLLPNARRCLTIRVTGISGGMGGNDGTSSYGSDTCGAGPRTSRALCKRPS